jgi:hypothetical protein
MIIRLSISSYTFKVQLRYEWYLLLRTLVLRYRRLELRILILLIPFIYLSYLRVVRIAANIRLGDQKRLSAQWSALLTLQVFRISIPSIQSCFIQNIFRPQAVRINLLNFLSLLFSNFCQIELWDHDLLILLYLLIALGQLLLLNFLDLLFQWFIYPLERFKLLT